MTLSSLTQVYNKKECWLVLAGASLINLRQEAYFYGVFKSVWALALLPNIILVCKTCWGEYFSLFDLAITDPGA